MVEEVREFDSKVLDVAASNSLYHTILAIILPSMTHTTFYLYIFCQVQVLNLISTLIGHVSEVLPYAQKLVQFFQAV